jgi:hypothetical protein
MDSQNFWSVEGACHQTRGERRQATREAARCAGRNRCYGGKGEAPAPDPNIGIAARENAALSAEQLQLGREELAWQREQFDKVAPVYNEVIQQQLGQMRTDADRATDQWNIYKTLFAPVEQRMVQDAMSYDSPERKERAAAGAAADVSSSYDAANGALQRNMQSLGVNPNDPKYAAIMSQAGLSRARDTAGAMNTARTNTEITGMSMRQGAAQFGRNMPATSIAQDAATLNAGNSATGTAGAQSAGHAQAIAAASPWYTGAVNSNTAAGNLYAQQYGLQLQGYQAQQQAAGGLWQGLGTLGGLALTKFRDGGLALTKFRDGGLVRREVERQSGAEAIEGDCERVADDAPIDPVDGELLDAIACGRRELPDGGMQRRATPAMTPDGVVDGAGTQTSDSVPARLSKDEAVLNAGAVQILGEDFINKINRAGLQRRNAASVDKYESGALVRRQTEQGELA